MSGAAFDDAAPMLLLENGKEIDVSAVTPPVQLRTRAVGIGAVEYQHVRTTTADDGTERWVYRGVHA